nr:hypothetical protein GCM10020093_078840 [Planobispora longispora]
MLGGVFAPLFPWISSPARAALADRLGAMRRAVPELAVSRLGADAAALGAAGSVLQRVIADPGGHMTTGRRGPGPR